MRIRIVIKKRNRFKNWISSFSRRLAPRRRRSRWVTFFVALERSCEETLSNYISFRFINWLLGLKAKDEHLAIGAAVIGTTRGISTALRSE